MQSNQISSIELAENIAKMQVSQNNAILQELMFPTPKSRQRGFFENGQGQTVYQYGNGNFQIITNHDSVNGWTV